MAQVSIPPLPKSRLVAAVALAGLLLIPRPAGACDGAPALATVPAEALAQSPPAEPEVAVSTPPSPSAPSRQWYGYQLMLADATSVGFTVLALRNERLDYAAIGGAASILLTPAIMHAIHGNALRAVASLFMRIAIPVTIGLVWHAANPCRPNEWFCGLDAVVFGGGIGLGTAMVIDWIWASKSPAPTPAPETKAVSAGRSRPIKLHAAAVAPVDGGGAKLVLGGSF
jgi:hypothetical protein